METGVFFLYLTIDNEEDAKKMAKVLLEERLCGCVNIYPEVRSLYWWEGKVEEGNEVVMIVKTRAGLADKVSQRIKELHPYSCPCIAKIPVEILYKPYEEWLYAETEQKWLGGGLAK